MTTDKIKARGYHPLTDEFTLPQEEELLESALRQLDRGRHDIQYLVVRTGDNERQIWSRPVCETYDDKL